MPPSSSGTDGTMNLSEIAATRPVLLRENTSARQRGSREAFPGVHSVARS